MLFVDKDKKEVASTRLMDIESADDSSSESLEKNSASKQDTTSDGHTVEANNNKYNNNDKYIPLQPNGSRNHINQFGDNHRKIINKSTVDNSKFVHNGHVINNTTYDHCVFNNDSEPNRKTAKSPTNRSRKESDKQDHPTDHMPTLTSNGGSTLEMDYVNDNESKLSFPHEMAQLKLDSFEERVDGSMESCLPSVSCIMHVNQSTNLACPSRDQLIL